jgi:ABC-2 type transport system permease protein
LDDQLKIDNKSQAVQDEHPQQILEKPIATKETQTVTVKVAKPRRPLLEGQPIFSMCLRELIRFFRMKTRTIAAIVSPFTWMILFGLPLSRLFPSSVSFEGLHFFAFIVPGIVGMGLLFSGTNSGVTVLWDKEFGFLKEVMVAPVRRTSLILGRSFGAMIIAMFQGLITIAVALLFGVWFGFHVISVAGFFIALGFMVVTFLTFVGFGLTLGALIEGTEGFMALVSMIEMPMFFLSGGMFPVNQVKGIPILYQVQFVNPLTYGVDGMRGALTGVYLMSPYLDFGIIAACAIFFVLLGTYAFTKMEVG